MEKEKKLLLVINPKSGKGQIKNRLLEILDIFTKAGYEIRIHITQEAMEAKAVVARWGGEVDLVVCSGGDGTLNETVSGMMELAHCPELGYIPAGSTNDFARSLRIPRQMAAAALAVTTGEPYAIDIGRFCQERYFIYVAGFGAFTEVSYLTSQDKKNLLGHQAYVLEGVKSLSSIKSYPMKVTGGEEGCEGDFIFGMVTNTISVGGFKGLVNQDVSLCDGQFEVLLIETPKTPLELSSIVSSLLLKDDKCELVHKFKANSLTVESEEPVDWVLDGEFGGSHSQVQLENLCQQVKIRRVLPKALKTGSLQKMT